MDPITLLLIAAISAATTAVTVVTWTAIQDWLDSRRIPGGTGRLIRERLATGQYKVVTGVFDRDGTLRSQATWRGASLDDALTYSFDQGGDVIIVQF
jgi:hypothetical protein